MHQDDPFAVDQQALEEKLKALQRSFERWRTVRSANTNSDAGGSAAIPADLLQDEFKWLSDEIIRSLKSLTWELNDLHETLRAMQQQQPAPQLAAAESSNRHLFISNSRALLSAIEAEVQPPAPQQQQQPHHLQTPASARPEDSSSGADVELLLGTESSAGPRPQPGGLRSFAKRHRGPLACLALILGLAFLLWVFYEAVLAGRPAGPQECACTAATSVGDQTTPGAAGGSSSTASANLTDPAVVFY